MKKLQIELVDFKSTDNLSTYILLPLLKLNKNIFRDEEYGFDNFINCFITKNYEIVVTTNNFVDMQIHPNHIASFESSNICYILFKIPSIYKEDVKYFLDGKYSKISKRVIDLIKLYSGLPYCQFDSDGILADKYLKPPFDNFINKDRPFVFHPLICALENSKYLRIELEKELGTYLEDDAELYSRPMLENEIIDL